MDRYKNSKGGRKREWKRMAEKNRRVLGWNRKRTREEREKKYEKTKCVGRRKLILVIDRPSQENPHRPEMRPEGKRRQMRNDRMGCTADILWLSASRRFAFWDHTHSCMNTHTRCLSHNFLSHTLTPAGLDTFALPHHLRSSGVLALLTREEETGVGFLAKANCSCSDSIMCHMSSLCETLSPQCVSMCVYMSVSLPVSSPGVRVVLNILSHWAAHRGMTVPGIRLWEMERRRQRQGQREKNGGKQWRKTRVKQKERKRFFFKEGNKGKEGREETREIINKQKSGKGKERGWKEYKKKEWEMSLVWEYEGNVTKTK